MYWLPESHWLAAVQIFHSHRTCWNFAISYHTTGDWFPSSQRYHRSPWHAREPLLCGLLKPRLQWNRWKKLTKAPVLAYPSFGRPFTDASVNGVVSQEQTAPYRIFQQVIILSWTQLSWRHLQLSGLWHSYLFGHLTILTDPSAVKI